MTMIDEIKRFINEKIFKKQPQKLLMSGTDIEESEENTINLLPIENYIAQDKYGRNLSVSFKRIKPSVKKNLLKKVETRIKGNYKFYT